MVCFDLGGVLARICTRWGEAAEVAGIQLPPSAPAHATMSECPEFDAYQHGLLDEPAYFAGLRKFLHLPDAEVASEVHRGILIEPYPGTERLVAELQEMGYATGCLSNTNGPHWQIMAHGTRFPAITSLGCKVASHEVKLEKPNPAIFGKFEEISGFPAENIVYFEDGQRNVESALRCGWKAHIIDPHGDPAAQMRDALGL